MEMGPGSWGKMVRGKGMKPLNPREGEILPPPKGPNSAFRDPKPPDF